MNPQPFTTSVGSSPSLGTYEEPRTTLNERRSTRAPRDASHARGVFRVRPVCGA